MRAYPDRKFPGQVFQLGERLDAQTRTLQVRVLVSNLHGLLKPEMFATAEFTPQTEQTFIHVPESAVQEFNGKSVVFVRTAPGKFTPREVTAGAQGRSPDSDSSGLEAGTPVVVNGAMLLKSQLLKSAGRVKSCPMLNRLISFSLDHRWATLSALLAFVVIAGYIASHIPIDAFPDLTNNQVVIITECPGLPPTEVEQLVTYPIESAVMGLPRTEGVRSISKLGLSVVTIILEDSVPTYFARQIVNERLQEVRSRLPEGLEPTLGPVATAFGEVYQYTIDGSGQSLMDRKTLQDWQIRNILRTVPGVNEVNSWGGYTKQYTIEVDPLALPRYGLTLRDVFTRLGENNRNFGGGFIEHAEQQYTIRGLGRAQGIQDLERIVLVARNGVPVLVRDVARVTVGWVPRQGAVLRDGKAKRSPAWPSCSKAKTALR